MNSLVFRCGFFDLFLIQCVRYYSDNVFVMILIATIFFQKHFEHLLFSSRLQLYLVCMPPVELPV